MVPVMQFDTPPDVSLLRVAVKRAAPLPADGKIPHIEARASRLERPVAEYARVCGFSTDTPLPLTFPDLLARGLHLAVLTHPAFPLRLFGIIHTEQRIEALRPIALGEALSGRAWVSGPRPARRATPACGAPPPPSSRAPFRAMANVACGRNQRRSSPTAPRCGTSPPTSGAGTPR